MKSNGLLKWLMIPVVALLVFLGIHLTSGRPDKSAAADGTAQLTPEEMKALGIDGDTPRDTVATLVAQVKQLRGELQTAVGENKNQRAENERLRQRDNSIDQRIQAAIDGERNRQRQENEQVAGDKQQTQSMLQDLQHKLDQLGAKGGSADLPVGLGLEEGDGKGFGASGASGVRWVEPDDARPDAGKTATGGTGKADRFPMRFGPADSGAGGGSASATPASTSPATEAKPAKPVYTLPTNATLMGSVAMTALIGRVPIDGTVNDPYPFKVLIGPDNLTANGIDLPEVAGAVVSGTASGDWTLSCVRGQIRSVTFVFRDGTIRTIPDDKAQGGAVGSRGGSGNGNAADGQGPILGGLGWISDPHGIPCVAGERRSNAQQYLGSQALITAAGAGAASLIKSDSGSVAVVSNGNGSLGTVGISGNEAMGRILAGGVQEMSQWVNKLYGQAFAAVYVPPGAQVAVHLEQPLQIDYEAQGRKVRHTTGGTHANDLD
ncbi:TIGR03752 family integrating conjugative element protein [Xanthomonas campestris pv. cannae]|nr:TIGR03752 family integrating conjugative element protein [Xanthomonas campestris pv. cannae]